MSNTAYSKNLGTLMGAFRNKSRVARALEVSYRHLTRAFETPNSKLSHHVASKARIIRLRALILMLRERGLVSDRDLSVCMKLVNIQSLRK